MFIIGYIFMLAGFAGALAFQGEQGEHVNEFSFFEQNYMYFLNFMFGCLLWLALYFKDRISRLRAGTHFIGME